MRYVHDAYYGICHNGNIVRVVAAEYELAQKQGNSSYTDPNYWGWLQALQPTAVSFVERVPESPCPVLTFHVWAGEGYNAWFSQEEWGEALTCYDQVVEQYGEGRLYMEIHVEDALLYESCISQHTP